jgi:hypothetical protein
MLEYITRQNTSVLKGWLLSFTGLWGAWLLAHPGAFYTAAGYAPMAVLAPEWLWGLVIVATASIAAALRGHRLGTASTMACFLLWSYVVLSFAQGSLSAPSLPAYAMVALGFGHCYLYESQRARIRRLASEPRA